MRRQTKKPVVFSYVNGRVGNQLFYYAIARMLDIQMMNGKASLVFSFYRVNEQHQDANDWFWDSLQYFNVKEYMSVDDHLISMVKGHGTFMQMIAYSCYCLLYKMIKKHNTKFFSLLDNALSKIGIDVVQPFADYPLKHFTPSLEHRN
ncbi:MAG: hypothetical protein LUH07_00220, partial [Lachnospiraceae bacterium]|nr:hypothetical protein [Lachnospiraceae bacterium]